MSDDEIKTLEEAVGILGNVKNKVEHAKEIKARKEKQWKQFEEKADKAGKLVWEKTFPRPDNRVDMFIISVAIKSSRLTAQSYLLEDLSKFDEHGIDFWINELWADAAGTFIANITSDLKSGARIMPDHDYAARIRTRFIDLREEIISKNSAIISKLEEFESAKNSKNVEITNFSKR